MKPSIATKAAVLAKLNQLLDEQNALLENMIEEAKKSRDNETKSSVGDKFETGRARLQTEIDRYNIQLNKTRQLKNELLQKCQKIITMLSLWLHRLGNCLKIKW